MNEIHDQDRAELRPAPNVVSIPFGSTWDIVTPSVFRYEDTRWINEFFETGKIRLSTFAKFATYPDEIRGDTSEGAAFCYGELSDNTHIGVFQRQGVKAAVLCCSHRLDKQLREGFQRDSAFEIMNTVAFSHEISRQLAGYRRGLEGSCIYRSTNLIARALNLDSEEAGPLRDDMDVQAVLDIGARLGGPEILLLKRKQYEVQQEYRLLWELDSIGADYVDVVAPLAIQYCRKVRAEEWET